jgi:hypothetical protein
MALLRSPTWTKPQFNSALQATEDAMTGSANVGPRSVPQHIGQAIETAAPGVFNAGMKDDIGVIWCRLNADRGGIN